MNFTEYVALDNKSLYLNPTKKSHWKWSVWEDHSDFKPEAEKDGSSADVCSFNFVEKKLPLQHCKRVNMLLNIQKEKLRYWKNRAYCSLNIYHFLRICGSIMLSFLKCYQRQCGYHCHLWDVLQIFLSLAKPQIQFVLS